MDKLPVFRLVIGDDEISGVLATSLVKDPAHETSFLTFSSEAPVEMKFKTDEKRNITGPLIIPNKMIYRRDDRRGEHYVYFAADDIERIANKMGKYLRGANINVEHSSELIPGGYLTEVWKTGKQDKANLDLGFNVPEMTLMGTVHVEDDDLWTKAKTGEVTGFSIEGLFGYQAEEFSKGSPTVLSQPTNEPTEIAVISILLDESMSEEDREKKLIALLGTTKSDASSI